MKVATLTLPLHVNYGAVLQAYALHQAIESFNCKPVLLDVRPSLYKRNLPLAIASHLKNKFRLLKEGVPEYGNKEFERFIEENLKKTKKLRFQFQLSKQTKFDLCIVGSDQVWRAEYALNIGMFFFDFLPEGSRRISYAASFGKSTWSYTPFQQELCKSLLGKFDAVSVREKTAVSLVKEKLQSNSTHVLDPTMIIPLKCYHNLISKGATSQYSKGDLFSYILDSTDEKRAVISSVSNKLCLIEKICNEGVSDKNKMSIENWLQGIRDSGFIITDSFHGMVFCILFEKEFLVLANSSRGYERFTSLLTDLGIPERLINEDELKDFEVMELDLINYEVVNQKISSFRDKSIEFLKNAIKS